MTHSYTMTYVLLELSESAYQEIKAKLEAAGYQGQFDRNPDRADAPRVRMHGIAVVSEGSRDDKET